MSQSRRPRSSARTERPSPKSPRPAAPAPAPGPSQIPALMRRIADLEAKKARVEAEHAADAEQLGRLLAATAEAEARTRVLEQRIERERQRGTDAPVRVLVASLVALRERVAAAKPDPVAEELDGLLRGTLTALEVVHEHADAIEQRAEVTQTSAEQHGESVVARAFAAVAGRAHATLIEIERVDALLSTVSDHARNVKKLSAALDEARGSLIAHTAKLVTAVRTLRSVTGTLATGAPPSPPARRRARPARG